MIKSLGTLIYFFMAQIVSCIGVFTYKAFSDYEWLNQVYASAITGDVLSAEYISLLNGVLYPALLISDIIIIMPILIKTRNSFCKGVSAGDVLYYVCLGTALNFVVSAVVDILPTGGYDSLMSIVLTGSPLIVFIVSGICAPIVEEIIFRYKIMGTLETKYSPRTALIVSSLLFGVAHMNPVQSTYAFLMGIVLGKIYQKEKNLIPSIIVHLTVNAGSVLYEYSGKEMRVALLLCVAVSFMHLFVVNKKTVTVRREDRLFR